MSKLSPRLPFDWQNSLVDDADYWNLDPVSLPDDLGDWAGPHLSDLHHPFNVGLPNALASTLPNQLAVSSLPNFWNFNGLNSNPTEFQCTSLEPRWNDASVFTLPWQDRTVNGSNHIEIPDSIATSSQYTTSTRNNVEPSMTKVLPLMTDNVSSHFVSHPFCDTVSPLAGSLEEEAERKELGVQRLEAHRPVEPLNDCFECKQTFKTRTALDWHALFEMHAAYACSCGVTSSRHDTLQRHIRNHGTDLPRFPCTHCKRHRGDKAFKRREHLEQHHRGYHNMEIPIFEGGIRFTCPHIDCPYNDMFPIKLKQVFKRQADYTTHMREIHNESPYPCEVLGCSKTGGKGYFRQKDLIKHRQTTHSDAPKITKFKSKICHPCLEVDCEHSGENGFLESYKLRIHVRERHSSQR